MTIIGVVVDGRVTMQKCQPHYIIKAVSCKGHESSIDLILVIWIWIVWIRDPTCCQPYEHPQVNCKAVDGPRTKNFNCGLFLEPAWYLMVGSDSTKGLGRGPYIDFELLSDPSLRTLWTQNESNLFTAYLLLLLEDYYHLLITSITPLDQRWYYYYIINETITQLLSHCVSEQLGVHLIVSRSAVGLLDTQLPLGLG